MEASEESKKAGKSQNEGVRETSSHPRGSSSSGLGGAGFPKIRRPLPEIPVQECQFRYDRSGGPGGQNVNKVNTKVTLRFSIENSRVLNEAEKAKLETLLQSKLTKDGELVIQCDETREQAQNKTRALSRLNKLLNEALKQPKKRKKTRPTAASKRRRLENKKRNSQKKRGRQSGHHED